MFTPAVVLLLVLVGGALRFYQLGHRSLWLDEVAVWDYSSTPGVWNMLLRIHSVPSLTPAVFLMDKITEKLADGDAAIRVHAALAGTLSIPLVFVLGRRLFSTANGLIAAGLVAVLPFLVWYSQENAAYALFMLLSVAQMIFAYMAVADGRLRFWFGLAGASLLDLYTHEIALTTTAAAFTFVGLALLIRGLTAWRRRHNARKAGTPLLLAFNAGLIVLVGYVPWIDAVLTFTHHQELGLARFTSTHPATLGDVYQLIGSYGFSGVTFVVLLAGIVAATLQVRRGRALEVGLLAAWMLVPIMAFMYSLRGGLVLIWPRYLIFLVPPAAVLVALGVEEGARLGGALAKRIGLRSSALAPAAGIIVVGLVLAQMVPSLASSYATPKDDWRGAAMHVVENSPSNSIVLSVGNYSDWAILCLHYYMKELHSQIPIVDGLQVTSDVVESLSGRHGVSWGIVNHPSAEQLALLTGGGVEKLDFVDATHSIYLVRSTDLTLSTADQASRLLRWEAPQEPALSASAAVLDVAAGRATLGPNLVPRPNSSPGEGWTYGPGISVDGTSLLLNPGPSNIEVNAAFTVSSPRAGDDFVISFDHLNSGLNGWQAVYGIAYDSTGSIVSVFPSGSGYACAGSRVWVHSYFPFQVPDRTASFVVFFRAHGTGQAAFSAVQLSRITVAP